MCDLSDPLEKKTPHRRRDTWKQRDFRYVTATRELTFRDPKGVIKGTYRDGRELTYRDFSAEGRATVTGVSDVPDRKGKRQNRFDVELERHPECTHADAAGWLAVSARNAATKAKWLSGLQDIPRKNTLLDEDGNAADAADAAIDAAIAAASAAEQAPPVLDAEQAVAAAERADARLPSNAVPAGQAVADQAAASHVTMGQTEAEPVAEDKVAADQVVQETEPARSAVETQVTAIGKAEAHDALAPEADGHGQQSESVERKAVAENSSPPSAMEDVDASIKIERIRYGQCPNCGNQTAEIGIVISCCGLRSREKRTALTIPGVVTNGVCLKCYPEHAAPVLAGALAGTMAAAAARNDDDADT